VLQQVTVQEMMSKKPPTVLATMKLTELADCIVRNESRVISVKLRWFLTLRDDWWGLLPVGCSPFVAATSRRQRCGWRSLHRDSGRCIP